MQSASRACRLSPSTGREDLQVGGGAAGVDVDLGVRRGAACGRRVLEGLREAGRVAVGRTLDSLMANSTDGVGVGTVKVLVIVVVCCPGDSAA